MNDARGDQATDSGLAQLAAVLKGRRTINLFAPEPAPRARLLEAVDAARWAPNHRLTEPWHFYLLGDETVARTIDLIVAMAAAENGEAAGARRRKRLQAVPGWFLVTCAVSDDALREREDYAACCCGVQNLMLYLWQAGIGVKWTTGAVTRDPRFYDLLALDPAAGRIVGLFWYGIPRITPTQKRAGVETIVTELP